MLLASAGCGVATLWAQTETGAIRSLETISLPARAANAIVGYVWYVQKMVWPTDLGVFYPNDPGSLGAGRVVLSAVVLVVISTCVWWYGRSCGFLTLGWSWYLVTLLPVIGIVQVGGQAHADRYAYVPLIGLFVMVIWGGHALASRLPRSALRAAALLTALTRSGTGRTVSCFSRTRPRWRPTIPSSRGTWGWRWSRMAGSRRRSRTSDRPWRPAPTARWIC